MGETASHYKDRTARGSPHKSHAGALEASGLGLPSVFDSIPGAFLFVNQAGHIESMNAAAKSLLGEPEGSFELEQWSERFGFFLDDAVTPYPGDKLAPVRALQGEAIEEQEMILWRDGAPEGIWVSISSQPLEEDGEILGAVTLIRDIDRRKKMEASRERNARRNEALYHLSWQLVETGNNLEGIAEEVAKLTSQAIGDSSFVTLLDSKTEKLRVAAYEEADPARRAQLQKAFLETPEFDVTVGLEGAVVRSGEPVLVPPALLEEQWDMLIPGMGTFARLNSLQSILVVPLSGPSGISGSLTLIRYQGRKPYNEHDLSFLSDIARRTAFAVENCRLFDSLREAVSSQQAAKRALDISEGRFRAVFEGTALGIKILDTDGVILQTNPAFQRMTGYDAAELAGRNFEDFIHGEDVHRASSVLRDVLQNGATATHFEHRTLHKDGTLAWLSTVFTKIKSGGEDNGPAFVVGILEDITLRKQMEQEMAELHNRLRTGHELERLRLAHELHDGPMQELYAAIYRLEDLRAKAALGMQETLDGISRDLKTVVQSLRATTTELRPPTLSAFGLERAIRAYAEDFRERFPNIAVELSLAQDRQLLPEEVRLGLFRVLQQALYNVGLHSQATRVRVRFSFDAEEASLEVYDNGAGFEMPDNLMEFLRQGHYGLAGAAERARAQGGSLAVESRPGEGTMVRVVIPWDTNTG